MSEETNAKKPSFLGMIGSPNEQFERMRERPAIWGTMIIVMILSVLSAWLMSLGVEVPGLEGLDGDEMAIVSAVGAGLGIIGGIIGPLIGVLIVSAIYLLIAKMAQSDVSFKQLFSMHTHIMFIAVLGSLLNGIIVAAGGNPMVVYTSLGSLVSDGAGSAVLNSIEIFSIWTVILTALGLQRVANFSKGLAWTIPIVFFVIGIIFAMIGASFAGMVGV